MDIIAGTTFGRTSRSMIRQLREPIALEAEYELSFGPGERVGTRDPAEQWNRHDSKSENDHHESPGGRDITAGRQHGHERQRKYELGNRQQHVHQRRQNAVDLSAEEAGHETENSADQQTERNRTETHDE